METQFNADASKHTSEQQEKLSGSRSRRRKAKSAGVLKTDLQVTAQERKLRETESKLLILQRRRQETLRMLNMGEKSEKRIFELEGETERLRSQQGVLKKRLKGELSRKKTLEEQVQQYQLKINGLSESNKQQSHVIRIKTEEVCVYCYMYIKNPVLS